MLFEKLTYIWFYVNGNENKMSKLQLEISQFFEELCYWISLRV